MLSRIILALTALSASVAATKCRTDEPRCPNENGCMATVANGAIFQLQCGTDYNGNIIQSNQAGSFADCADACAYVPGCSAFNYKGEFCYLLGLDPGTARTSTTVAAGFLTKAGMPVSSNANPCSPDANCDDPSTDGCSYVTHAGTFKADCNTDFYGNDMAITFSDDLGGCIKNCANAPGCKAVSWSTGTCYLKNAGLNGLFSQWVDAAVMQ